MDDIGHQIAIAFGILLGFGLFMAAAVIVLVVLIITGVL